MAVHRNDDHSDPLYLFEASFPGKELEGSHAQEGSTSADSANYVMTIKMEEQQTTETVCTHEIAAPRGVPKGVVVKCKDVIPVPAPAKGPVEGEARV